ncbi:MAG: hypothetical protein U5K56_07035 [Halioglobus sp.]|nr:hypothetical protein [Halioglobus sp.]
MVELCTAVKGPALQYLFNELEADRVFYFDPDIVVFGRLGELEQELAGSSVLLTPHLTDPDSTDMGILDNRGGHPAVTGVFNLGFVGQQRTGGPPLCPVVVAAIAEVL